MYRETELSLIVRLRPNEAARRIIKAYNASKCNLVETAKQLEVASRTLSRWIDVLDLSSRLDAIKARAKEEGWHHDHSRHGGAPEGNVNGSGGRGIKHVRRRTV